MPLSRVLLGRMEISIPAPVRGRTFVTPLNLILSYFNSRPREGANVT